MYNYLDFENVLAEIDARIAELKLADEAREAPLHEKEIKRLQKRAETQLRELYKKLTPWQKTQVARHQNRPRFLNYAKRLFTDITPLAGDRQFGEDEAIQAGLARFKGQAVAYIGQEKGWDTKSRVKYNFGSALPEGYRKAIRIMQMAERFGLPLITLVDTAGAYPGVSAEERGQAEAIARSTQQTLELGVPVVSVIIGEGGSGGAIAIAAANKVYMLEHSIYSVISPEGAASILWHDSSRAIDAATNMRITAQDLFEFKIIDGIIAEPLGGAHRDSKAAIDATGNIIEAALNSLSDQDSVSLKNSRREKFLNIGRHLGS